MTTPAVEAAARAIAGVAEGDPERWSWWVNEAEAAVAAVDAVRAL